MKLKLNHEGDIWYLALFHITWQLDYKKLFKRFNNGSHI